MKKLFLLFILLTTIALQAQYTTIPDANFEQALINRGIDIGPIDGRVLTANVSGVSSINLQFANITDLTGIESFTSLIYLATSIGNQFDSLDLSQNVNLQVLFCDQNGLKTLDVSKNINLTQISCAQNQLTSLDVSKNTNLARLDCRNNELTTLNLKNGNNSALDSTLNPDLSCILVDNVAYFNASYTVFKDLTSRFSETCQVNVAPIITATGNQVYCPQSSLKIATAVTITDPDDTSTDAIYIQISSGYVNGQDKLSFVDTYNITSNWDPTTGKLKLHNQTNAQVPYIDFIAAIKDVVFSNSNNSPSGIRDFSISIGEANYLPSNGHYYQYFSNLGITWTNAKAAAEASNYYRLQGYLATITAADEAKISGEQAAGAGWIGGSDATTEGVWKWVTGPEGLANGGTGTTFWNGLASGSTTPPYNFAFWNTAEPNQYNGAQENYAHITAPGVGITGSWNDLTNTGDPAGNYQPKGYIVEYGGMPGDPILNIAAFTTITIPKITSSTGDPRCGSGTVTLQATASDGAINWYANATGGTSLATANSYTTPVLSTTTSYFVDATDGNCPSNLRTEVTAIIKSPPTITATTPGSVCNSGTVTLGAVAFAGTINWYNVSTGGSILATGSTFTTPSISTTTTYYAEAIADGCTSLSRTAITATVNNSPTITATTASSRCGSGSVILEANPSTGNVNWFDVAIGGSPIFTGNSFTTLALNTSTTYYAEAVSNGCKSNRTPVTATVFPINTITEEVILCQGETTTLDASIPNMIYLWSPGGETTQTIVASTIGNHSVTISSPTIISCESKKDISVIEHPQPIISSIAVNENSIVIELENPEDYFEYSINSTDFQALNQFSYIPTGQHTAFVRENNGCNIVTQQFIIFTIPEFFTPNNDGFNDVWRINEMVDYPNSIAQIFDRYGKLIIELNSSNNSWDGKYYSKNLPTDDYWYRLKLDNTKSEIRGHFTLKR
ncbi:T9SS type B sorting domain-containing protein [Flavobacterium sp. Arc2]|jgi:gliding motility-associated-like protein|uniref:Ig-like domain-containing protein n=1 Tax=Flavobacterium sp. Arc2 TaxID=3046685 RepID=UPI00352BF294